MKFLGKVGNGPLNRRLNFVRVLCHLSGPATRKLVTQQRVSERV